MNPERTTRANTPARLAEEALEHFRRARQGCGDSQEVIKIDEKEVREAVKRGEIPVPMKL